MINLLDEEVVSECPECHMMHTEYVEIREGEHVCIECYASFIAGQYEVNRDKA